MAGAHRVYVRLSRPGVVVPDVAGADGGTDPSPAAAAEFQRGGCAHQVPTLLVTGEPRLDRVIPVESTREYIGLIPGVRYQMMERTGHLGLVTQPDRFARIVSDFVNASDS